MQSRGFRGTIVTLKPFKMKTHDWIWLSIFLTLAAIAILLGH
jgi:energy-coupling factor transporter transmembrane protein EcfT